MRGRVLSERPSWRPRMCCSSGRGCFVGARRRPNGGALPGDDLAPDARYVTTRAATIDAPVEAVWPWLLQMGQDRAGFYTHNWVERLLRSGIPDTSELRPEWQHLEPGDLVRTNRDIGGRPMGWPVEAVDAGRSIVLRSRKMPTGSYAFVLRPTDAGNAPARSRPRSLAARRVAVRRVRVRAASRLHGDRAHPRLEGPGGGRRAGVAGSRRAGARGGSLARGTQTYDRITHCYAVRVGSGSDASRGGKPAADAPRPAPPPAQGVSRRCATSRPRPGSRRAPSRASSTTPRRAVPIAAETRERVIARRAQARLPAQPARPRPARRVDDAPRRGRPRHHRPVLRGRDRGPVGRGDGARLQRRPRPRPRPRRRGARADGRARDAPLRCDRPARRHAGPAAPARRPARLARPGRRPVAGLEPAGGPDGRRRQPRPASAPGSTTSSTSATRGSPSSAAACSATSASAQAAFVEFMAERFGGVPGRLRPAGPEHRPRAARPRSARCSPSTGRRRRS